MSRKAVVGWVVVMCLLVAIGVGGIVFVLNSGFIVVVSNVSSGQTDDSVQHEVGYIGRIVAAGAHGSITESGLDPHSHQGAPLIVIPGGTKVKVINSKEDTAQIEILEGKERGMKPWIHWSDLQ